MIHDLASIPIGADPYLPTTTYRKQFRFPRSKKSRIRKKWAKNHKNFKSVETHSIWIVNGVYTCRPEVLGMIKNVIA